MLLLTEFVGYIKRRISSNQSLCVGKPTFHRKSTCFHRKLVVRSNLSLFFSNWAYDMFRLLVVVLLTKFVGYIRRPISSNQSICVGKPSFHRKTTCFQRKLVVCQNLPVFSSNWAYDMFKLLVVVLLTKFVGYIKRPISLNQSICVGKASFHRKNSCFQRKLVVR